MTPSKEPWYEPTAQELIVFVSVLGAFFLFLEIFFDRRREQQPASGGTGAYKDCWICISGTALGLLSHPASMVRVIDSVLQDSSLLHALDASLKRRGGLGHAVLDRHRAEGRSCSSICERVIDALLQSLGDRSRYVEYWYRDEWINLEAHQDVDEHLARAAGPQRRVRFPSTAHVLYLHCGEAVAGPTCVFLNSSAANSDGGEELSFDTLVVVPAQANRLLRFRGDLYHAVPRPALAYLDPCEGGSNLELHVRTGPPQEGAPDRRAVLLFNTWDEPPLDVPQHDSSDDGDDAETIGSVEISLDSEAVVEHHGGTADRQIVLKAMLLGDAFRRAGSRSFRCRVSEGVRHGLQDRSLPLSYSLQQG